MASVIDVATYVLDLIGAATTMKLQKLVYYAQARHLVLYEKPLFSESIEAWINGPVVPVLYWKHSGRYLLRKGELNGNSQALSDTEKRAIRDVCAFFGDYSGETLRELTHNERPWIEARNGYALNESSKERITVEAICAYYRSHESKNPVSKVSG